jgi:hypothetical protein
MSFPIVLLVLVSLATVASAIGIAREIVLDGLHRPDHLVPRSRPESI